MRSINALLLITTLLAIGKVTANDTVCFQLARGEATQNQRPAFKKLRGCNNEQQNCDIHKRLGIPLQDFDESLPQRLVSVFDECIQNSARQSATANLKNYQQEYSNNQDKITALIRNVQEGKRILNALVTTLEQAESLKQTMLVSLESDDPFSIFRENHDKQLNSILSFQERINQLYADLGSYHQTHKLRANEFPTNHSNVQNRVDEINATLDVILQFQVNRVLSEIYLLIDGQGNPVFRSSWNSQKQKGYQQKVLAVIEAQERLTLGANKYLALSNQETQQRHNELVSYSASLSKSLPAIDEAITQSMQLEKVKAANQAWLDAIPTNNIVLVATNLGYTDGFILLGGKNVFPFHTYLGCLAEYYRGYLFQGYEIDGENRSKQLLLKFYSGTRATDANLSTSIAIARISQDRYVFADIQEYETGYDQVGQVKELSFNLIDACRREFGL